MLVELKSLKPNPLRDFTVDPVDEDRVKDLKGSIEEDGFWGGVVGRRIKGGEIEVAAGWHRVKAAIAAGLRSADIFIAPQMTDGDMVRIYSRENATQRGNSGTAQAGSIAAAVRILAKALATGNLSPIGDRFTKRAIEVAAGTMASGDGIGAPIIEELLDGIPGMSKRLISEQLSILKASGQYDRIIAEVKEEIEEENREALAKLKKAEEEQRKADEQAAKAEAERKEAAAKAKAAKAEADRKRAELAERRAEEEAKLAAKRQQEA
jgi:flagellar biosynthesis GTPase FlhF